LKIFITILVLVFNLNAFDIKIAAKIFDKIFTALIQKDTINVYTKDKEYIKVVRLAQHLKLMHTISNADIVLINDNNNLPKNNNIPLFTTNLTLYEKHKNMIGVFYWKHGRPKIAFSKEGLLDFKIILDSKWKKYVKKKNEL